MTTTWNGIEKLTAADVLELARPDAARWWNDCADPEDLGCSVRDLPRLAWALGLPRGIGTRALRYARACALERDGLGLRR